MLDKMKFSVLTLVGLLIALVALGVGVVIAAGLFVAGAVLAIVNQNRIRTLLRHDPRMTIIEAEYHEVPPRTGRR